MENQLPRNVSRIYAEFFEILLENNQFMEADIHKFYLPRNPPPRKAGAAAPAGWTEAAAAPAGWAEAAAARLASGHILQSINSEQI